MNVTLTINDQSFECSARQAATLETLQDARAGGFAKVRGYVATSGRVSPETADYTVLTRFSTARLYERRIAALNAITLSDVAPAISKNPKLAVVAFDEIESAFNARKIMMIDVLQKSLDGERTSAQHAAHDRCYASVAQGIRVHFVTEKDSDGLKQPVLNAAGLPIVESIMLNAVTINKQVLVEGAYKPVNSGVPVLIGNAIEALLPKSSKFIALSLKSDNFDSVVIDGEVLQSKDVAGDWN